MNTNYGSCLFASIRGSSMRFATGVPTRQLTTSYMLKRKLQITRIGANQSARIRVIRSFPLVGCNAHKLFGSP